ncbi:MAG: polar flagellar assembly protein FliO [Bdellovibrio sp. ArHS]|uniref:FliO/MopB family protein n=1 Tax=Bdellovibrio sp. ArHS TaxID=1569284 RepID=UPI0005833B6D|nr:flagellar biosynthetic protein FliO [Bdellovibrio sp. ArHS]KHD89125.1 MAG: polar flagellar assembly protein FliO [Bdellovibrio sp. ArHS]
MRLLLSLLFVFSVSAQAAETTAPSSVTAEVSATAEAPAGISESAKIDNRKESEIPLNLEGNKKATSEGSGLFRILFTLSILGLVGTGAFIFLRKYSIPKAKQHQTQIKVLQQHYLGPKKSLAIVRVAGESILVGITDHNISMIKSLSLLDDEMPEEVPQSFGKVLGSKASFDEGTQEPEAPASRKKASALETDDDFAISGIKDIVSKRLKGMRSLQ